MLEHAEQTRGMLGKLGPRALQLVDCFGRSRTFDRLFEVLKFEVSVDFGGVEITMAQELLDVTNAGTATQEMRRAAVPKGVD